jgi:hypothetical protein
MRATYLGLQAKDRFSGRGFRGWHQVQRLITFEGLKSGKSEYDFAETADKALEILRDELRFSFRVSRWLHRWKIKAKRKTRRTLNPPSA